MTWLWWLILGLLGGWLIELVIDFRFWRRRAAAAQQKIVEQEIELGRKAQAVATREAEAANREREIGVREEALAARDADLLAQATRIDERDQEITRIEQRLDARRIELEKHTTELIERDHDIATRTKTLKAQEATHAEREASLVETESKQSRLQATLGSRETALKNWEQRILAKEQDIGLREAASTQLAREHSQWQRQIGAMRKIFGSRYRTSAGEDDLQAIEGIGPKAITLLGAAGISSFERLADTPLGELSRLVEQGGAELALADPMSWAEQAGMIATQDFVGFENLKASLRGEAPLLSEHESPTPGEDELPAITGAEIANAEPLEVRAISGLDTHASDGRGDGELDSHSGSNSDSDSDSVVDDAGRGALQPPGQELASSVDADTGKSESAS